MLIICPECKQSNILPRRIKKSKILLYALLMESLSLCRCKNCDLLFAFKISVTPVSYDPNDQNNNKTGE